MSLMKYLLVIGTIFICLDTSAQNRPEEIRSYMPTENISPGKEANTKKNKPKRKKISFIYKESSKGTLYGNPCAIEATRKMGFEYVVQKQGIPGSVYTDEAAMNNFWVNMKLIFTRGPFWKIILNKRFKECRKNSGDIVG